MKVAAGNEICIKGLSGVKIVCIMKKLWELIGSGVPPGLQNRRKRLVPALVGSIPTCSRQIDRQSDMHRFADAFLRRYYFVPVRKGTAFAYPSEWFY